MNLVVNARDAMPTGGRLTLSLANADLPPSEADTLPPGAYVLLTVSDTGVGMDAETRARAFEPLYTTKAAGKGTGLGLATVYGIVTQNAGDVRIESEPGRGTTFRIFFPRVDAPADAAPAVSTAPLPGGGETVLVVEDEDAVRSLAVTALRKLGYTVLEAPDAERAVEVFAGYGGRVDLLVTDVVMPGMNGPSLAERLLGRDATLRVLYVSGYAEEAPETAAFLAKPYTGVTLARKVREVLDA